MPASALGDLFHFARVGRVSRRSIVIPAGGRQRLLSWACGLEIHMRRLTGIDMPSPREVEQEILQHRFEHLSVVRIEQIGSQTIQMTRIGTRRVYAMRAGRGPLTKKMKAGSVWRVRWRRIAGLRIFRDHAVLIDAQPISLAWKH
jgi:hypothetical protein